MKDCSECGMKVFSLPWKINLIMSPYTGTGRNNVKGIVSTKNTFHNSSFCGDIRKIVRP